MRNKNKIRLGMIGGGTGSMIGSVHRYAARLDHCYDLVAAVFSTSLKKSQQLGHELGINMERIYPDYQTMLAKELMLPMAERIEALSIVTPNHTHFAIAKCAMHAGLHVIMDKPLTITLAEAKALQHIQTKRKKLFCITYTYAGYPMIKEARHLLQNNHLGKIRKIIVDYPQGWLSDYQENKHKQASWRQDPNCGIAGTIADIGTHAFHLAEYVSDAQVTHVNAQINTFVKRRLLDDDASILLRFDNRATGVITVSQIAAGEEANININVYAERGSIFWQHKDANKLVIKWREKPTEIRRSGSDNSYLSNMALHNCRTPAGHPEGYIEAFANHYRNFAFSIHAHNARNITLRPEWDDYPKMKQGVRGVAFIESVIASAKSSQQKWTLMLN